MIKRCFNRAPHAMCLGRQTQDILRSRSRRSDSWLKACGCISLTRSVKRSSIRTWPRECAKLRQKVDRSSAHWASDKYHSQGRHARVSVACLSCLKFPTARPSIGSRAKMSPVLQDGPTPPSLPFWGRAFPKAARMMMLTILGCVVLAAKCVGERENNVGPRP